MTQDGVVGRRTINNQEQDIFGDLLRVITDHHKQSDYAKRVYSHSFESNEWCVGWNQSFSLNPYLLEHRVVEDISRAPIVHMDPLGVVVPHLYANYERIIIWVMEMLGIFLCELNYKVVDPCHLWDKAPQLDILHHS